MSERIIINAKNMNIGQGNTNNGIACIGDNNTNDIADSKTKRKKQETEKAKNVKKGKVLLFMDMMPKQNLKSLVS